MNGILIVDKPEGVTSADVVRRVRRQLPVKVGHLGTLDPFATGVLPLCLGEATKIAQFLSTADKSYEGVIRLGAATDTGDRTGQVVRTAPIPACDERRLSSIASRFTGESLQTPPMYSALKRGGVPLYRLARRGIEVERAERPVRIASLRLEAVNQEDLRFEVTCSKGTYIRVLAEDIGVAFGSAAHVYELRRIRFGPFGIAHAVNLETWDARRGTELISIRQALSYLPGIRITHEEARAARLGQPWVLERISSGRSSDVAVLVDPVEMVAAVVVKRGGRWSFGRVLQAPEALQQSAPVLVKKDT